MVLLYLPHMNYRYLFVLFTVITGLQSCIKDYSYERGPAVNSIPTVTDTSFFVDMMLDGKREVYVSGQYNYFVFFWGGAPVLNSPQIYSSGLDGSTGAPHFRFEKGFLIYTNTDTSRTLIAQRALNFFAPADYFYSDLLREDGVRLVWIDPDGTEWKTIADTLQNADNIFTITESKTNTLGAQLNGIIINALFTCKIYNNRGQSKRITKGRFRLPIWL